MTEHNSSLADYQNFASASLFPGCGVNRFSKHLLSTCYRALFNRAIAESADCPMQNIDVSSAYINREPELTEINRCCCCCC